MVWKSSLVNAQRGYCFRFAYSNVETLEGEPLKGDFSFGMGHNSWRLRRHPWIDRNQKEPERLELTLRAASQVALGNYYELFLAGRHMASRALEGGSGC